MHYHNQLLKNENGLSVIHHNVNRLVNKLDEIRTYLKSHYPATIYSCSETFLDDSKPDHFLSIDGYKIIRKDRICNEGGGLIVYVKNCMQCIRRQDLENELVETIWIEVSFNQKKILLAFVYRPPNENTITYNTWINYMEEAISSAYVEDKNIIILGDFNIDLLKKHPRQESSLTVTENYELSQLITKYTRITQKTNSLIDHIYVSEGTDVKHSDVLPWAISDHFPVYLILDKLKVEKQSNKKHIEISYRNI